MTKHLHKSGVVQNILVVYNPVSGRHRFKKSWPALSRYFPKNEYHLVKINTTDDSLFSDLKKNNYSSIIVIGGDGTLRRVIQVLQSQRLKIPIAVLPRGTANLLAKSLKIPQSLSRAAAVIRRGNTIALDCAKIDDHYFVGAYAMGYLSERVTNASQSMKRLAGFLGYIHSFMKQRSLPQRTFDIIVDGASYTQQGHSLFIVNTANVFGVQGKRAMSYRDGVFELIIATNTSFISLFALLYDFYFRKSKPKYFKLIPGKKFSVTSSEKINVQLDGETLKPKSHAVISVLPKAQKFIIP